MQEEEKEKEKDSKATASETQAPGGQEPHYSEQDIVTLDWQQHIRLRPGMYIGKLGDGAAPDDGIYVLLKEVIDNAVDEYMMGYGRQIFISQSAGQVSVRDYGRGIPLGKLVDVAAKMNTGAKYDSQAFKKSVGLNGVGIKAVNALSETFIITSIRDGLSKSARFARGILQEETPETPTTEPNGTLVEFVPDPQIFTGYQYRDEYIVPMLKNYTFLNTGLTLLYNGQRYLSRHGLLDLLDEYMTKAPLYPVIHLQGPDIEIAFTHAQQYGEEYYTFVNGQHTTQGGTHQAAFKEAVARTIKEYAGKAFEPSDVRGGLIAAVAVKVEEPVFESQTKTKLGSKEMAPGSGLTVNKFVGDFVKRELDNYLHRHLDVADVLVKKVQDNERERKAMNTLTKVAREKAKKIAVNNKKLLDCRVHLNDARGRDDLKAASSIFLTEGDSAAGSITKIRDVATQAVFSLRGKPLNTFGLTRKVVYENDEFNLLQAALNIEDDLDGLRYNKVIIATDADVDGMHIRLLLITFFLQFFPDLIKKGHVYVLQTPLFRVRKPSTNRTHRRRSQADEEEKDVYYCYTEQERLDAIERVGKGAEITRFKGLGEISPDEFKAFIGPGMRLDRVTLRRDDAVGELLEFYMGKNTSERQRFIIDNLIVEEE